MKTVLIILAVLVVLGHCHIPAVHVLQAVAVVELAACAVLCCLIRRAARWRMRRLA